MIASVSLLFIAMIPIDCKITKFSLHLFVYFFLLTIIKKKNNYDYNFCGCHTH